MDIRALSRIAPPTRGIVASFAHQGIAVCAPPQPCPFRSRLRRKGDLVALGLDNGGCRLLTAWIRAFSQGEESRSSWTEVQWTRSHALLRRAEKMTFKRFMPVARGTRPAYSK